jgi:hypothetical protein
MPPIIREEPRKIPNSASLFIASRYAPPSQTQKARRDFRICSMARITPRMTRPPSIASPTVRMVNPTISGGEIGAGMRRCTETLVTRSGRPERRQSVVLGIVSVMHAAPDKFGACGKWRSGVPHHPAAAT